MQERGGSSRLAILKYIMKKYELGQDDKLVNSHLKLALRSGIKNGSLKQSKGTGVTGSFCIGVEKQTKAGKKPKAAGAKKPKVTKKPRATGLTTKTQKPKKSAVAGGAGTVKKPKVAKKPKSPAKTAKPTAAKKPKAMKTAKPKVSKAQKPKAVKSKKVAAK